MEKFSKLKRILHNASMEKRAFLSKLADDVNNPSSFDETVPPIEQSQQSEGGEEGLQESQPGAQGAPGEDYAAVPDENYAGDQNVDLGGTPEEVGARAAQAFIGPEVMQMAMQGDPAATELISRTAGQIAGGIATSFMKSQMEPQMGMQPGMEVGMPPQQGGMMQPPPPQVNQTTPEDDLANSIAPVPMQTANQAGASPNDVPATPY